MLRGKAGVLSDQLDRRRLLITADLIAAAAGAVAVIAGAGRLTPTGLIVLSLGIGTAAAIFNPAYGPLLSHTVPTEQLARANGLDAAVTNAANLTAPALGGWLYAAGGAVWALGANSISFLAATACTALLRLPHQPPTDQDEGQPADAGAGAAAGWRYLRTSGWLPPLLGLALVLNLRPGASPATCIPRDTHNLIPWKDEPTSGDNPIGWHAKDRLGRARFADELAVALRANERGLRRRRAHGTVGLGQDVRA
jgi:MFS family permease